MPFCNQCGADVAGVKFCSKCGAPVGDAAAPAANPGPAAAPAASSGGEVSENILAALAYFIWPVAIVLLLIEPYKNRRFLRFHCFQVLFLVAAWFVVGVGLSITSGILGWAGAGILVSLLWFLLWAGGLVLWVFLIVKAYQGQEFHLPVIGELAQKQV